MTVKPFFDTRIDRKNELYPIFICVRHGSKVKYIPTGHKIPKEHWNTTEVKKSYPNYRIINAKITSIISDTKNYYADCNLHNRPFNIDLVGTGRTSYSFIDYLIHRSKQFDGKGQIIMSRKVKRLSVELQECFGSLYFDEINQDTLRKLETWLIKQGNVNNTRAKKFAKLRQFYDHAIDDAKASAPNPFKKYKILTKPVRKEKLTLGEVKVIEDLVLQPGAVLNARNLFLFSFYCKGMRFENCLLLRRKDIKEGRIYFRSNKGNKYISVKLHDRLQALISTCDGKDFVFPYVKEIPEEKKDYIKMIDSLNVVVNRNLKLVAAMAEITKHLTFHIARHTFADQLKKHSGNIQVIKDALGHSDTRTTELYLSSLGDEVLDKEMDKLYGG